MNEADTLGLLEVRAGGQAIAIPIEYVQQVLAASEWLGSPPVVLGALLGAESACAAPSRIVLLSAGSNSVPLGIDKVVAVTSIPRRDVLPLPPLVRRAAPKLAALAVRTGSSILMLDPAALLPRALSSER